MSQLVNIKRSIKKIIRQKKSWYTDVLSTARGYEISVFIKGSALPKFKLSISQNTTMCYV